MIGSELQIRSELCPDRSSRLFDPFIMRSLRRHCNSGVIAIAVACLLVTCLTAASARAGEIRIITEEFPPYDFTGDNGEVKGISTEVVREVLADLGMEVKIDAFPWARAFKMAREKPNTMLFSVVRTADREALFHWVGVVYEIKSFIFRLSSRDDITETKLSGLKKYSIGGVRGWAGQKYLETNGFERLQKVANSELNLKKLITGRVDLIEDYEANLTFRMQKLDLDPDLVERVYFNADISGPLFAVFSKSTKAEVVESFKHVFSAIHLDGRYDAIQRRWR